VSPISVPVGFRWPSIPSQWRRIVTSSPYFDPNLLFGPSNGSVNQ
jgi:hypothetical protein